MHVRPEAKEALEIRAQVSETRNQQSQMDWHHIPSISLVNTHEKQRGANWTLYSQKHCTLASYYIKTVQSDNNIPLSDSKLFWFRDFQISHPPSLPLQQAHFLLDRGATERIDLANQKKGCFNSTYFLLQNKDCGCCPILDLPSSINHQIIQLFILSQGWFISEDLH